MQVIDLVLIDYAFHDVRYHSLLLDLDSAIFICLSNQLLGFLIYHIHDTLKE